MPRFRVYACLLYGALCANAWASELKSSELSPLPEPVSNNAVAALPVDGGVALFSMQGLAVGRTFSDIHNRAWVLHPGAAQWQALPDVPGDAGRLAGVATVAGAALWLFGGYTVAEDGAERSAPEVFKFDGDRFVHVTNMPVPVDDMIAFTYRDRYVYLVSGWHDVGNVNLVQVLDTRDLTWSQATPFPGAPVFGHAGGMVDNRMLVCDGVLIRYPADGSPRRFEMSDECWLGVVDDDDHRRIAWRPVPPHPGAPRYRMAAGGSGNNQVVFAGGTDNPYNYDGIGYDGVPAAPSDEVIRFDLQAEQWSPAWQLPEASMDHRGLPAHDGCFYLMGGMRAGQAVTDRVVRWCFDPVE